MGLIPISARRPDVPVPGWFRSLTCLENCTPSVSDMPNPDLCSVFLPLGKPLSFTKKNMFAFLFQAIFCPPTHPPAGVDSGRLCFCASSLAALCM